MSQSHNQSNSPSPPFDIPMDPNGVPNIFQMAQQIAQNMPTSDTSGKDIDMPEMVKYVTESVTKMMGSNDVDLSGVTNTLVQTFENMQQDGSLPPIPNSKVNLDPIEPKSLKSPKDQEQDYFEELDDDSDADEFQPRTKDLHFNMNVNLEDFYKGKTKKLAIRRKRIKKENGKTKIVEEKKKIAIKIEPGMRDEQIIRFNKEADELPGHETGDIVITLCENPHGYFEREGDNLFIVKKISLYEALAGSCGEPIVLTIKHLDGTILKIPTNKQPLHSNEGIRKIKGEGMPLFKKEGYGDLFIRFNLDIPENFPKSKIEVLKEIFPPFNSNSLSGDKERECTMEEVTEEDMEALDYDYSSDESDYSDSDYTSEEEEPPRPVRDRLRRKLEQRRNNQ